MCGVSPLADSVRETVAAPLPHDHSIPEQAPDFMKKL